MSAATVKLYSNLFLVLLGCGVLSVSAQSTAKMVKFCDLFKPMGPIKTVTFRSSSYMSISTISRVDGADEYMYSPACNSADYFATFESEKNAWNRYPAYLTRLAPERNHILRITFEGQMEVANANLYGSLDGWARAKVTILRVLEVQTLTEDRSIAKPDFNAPNPEIERIQKFRTDFMSFLEFLFSSPTVQISSFLSADFALMDDRGLRVPRNEVLQRTEPIFNQPGSSMQISRSITDSSSKEIIGIGTVEFIKVAPRIRYICETRWVPIDGQWMLQTATVRKQ